jgi:hypothetical protein
VFPWNLPLLFVACKKRTLFWRPGSLFVAGKAN